MIRWYTQAWLQVNRQHGGRRTCVGAALKVEGVILQSIIFEDDKTVHSGGSSIRRTRRTPPPLIGENIAFSCIFWNKVKVTILVQPKCGLRPLLLHILDPPLVHLATSPLHFTSRPKCMPVSMDPGVTIVNPTEISVVCGYVTWRMTTEISVMYGSEGDKTTIMVYNKETCSCVLTL